MTRLYLSNQASDLSLKDLLTVLELADKQLDSLDDPIRAEAAVHRVHEALAPLLGKCITLNPNGEIGSLK